MNLETYLPRTDSIVLVEFDYSEGEPMTYWHPGCAEEVEITSVVCDGAAIELDQSEKDSIEQACFDHVHAGQEMASDEYEMLREQDHKERDWP